MATAQLYGSVVAPARRCSLPSFSGLRFSPLASRVRGPFSAATGRGSFHGFVAPSKPSISMCMKTNSTSTPIDPSNAVKYTEHQNLEASKLDSTLGHAGAKTVIDEEVSVPQKKCAKIHDFCLGIPFGGLLFCMGLIGYIFWRSPVSLTFGVAPGLTILALGVLSLKIWRSGKSSLPFILAQGAVAGVVAWKYFQAFNMTKKLLPWGFYGILSAAMICFYSYVLLAGGNPPPKKKSAAALS